MTRHAHVEDGFVVADKALAPFTARQAVNLNDYQNSGVMHPFTCGNDTGHRLLVAAIDDGWYCLDCDYWQNWAHSWMADGSWRSADWRLPS